MIIDELHHLAAGKLQHKTTRTGWVNLSAATENTSKDPGIKIAFYMCGLCSLSSTMKTGHDWLLTSHES